MKDKDFIDLETAVWKLARNEGKDRQEAFEIVCEIKNELEDKLESMKL